MSAMRSTAFHTTNLPVLRYDILWQLWIPNKRCLLLACFDVEIIVKKMMEQTWILWSIQVTHREQCGRLLSPKLNTQASAQYCISCHKPTSVITCIRYEYSTWIVWQYECQQNIPQYIPPGSPFWLTSLAWHYSSAAWIVILQTYVQLLDLFQYWSF